MARHSKSSSRGLTLMELLVSVIILAAVIVGVVMLIDQALSDSKATVTGQYIKSFGTAANAYIRDNYADLTAAASDTVPALITAADLNPATGKSYLNGARATTPDGQNICVLVFEKTPGALEGLVVTEGGTALDDLTLGQVAGTIGGAGGGAYAHDSAATIKGTMGGWSLTTASYTNITNNKGKKCDGVTAGAVQVTAGHPAMALWFQDMTSGTAAAAAPAATDLSGLLHRETDATTPALNTMETPIRLGAGAVRAEGTACTEGTGAIAKDSNGLILSCQSGLWKKAQGNPRTGTPRGQVLLDAGLSNWPLGVLCGSTIYDFDGVAGTSVVYTAAPIVYGGDATFQKVIYDRSSGVFIGSEISFNSGGGSSGSGAGYCPNLVRDGRILQK